MGVYRTLSRLPERESAERRENIWVRANLRPNKDGGYRTPIASAFLVSEFRKHNWLEVEAVKK
jgi:hypothetical protein